MTYQNEKCTDGCPQPPKVWMIGYDLPKLWSTLRRCSRVPWMTLLSQGGRLGIAAPTLFIFLFFFSASAHAATLYWVGPSGGNTGDVANWRTSNPNNCNPPGDAGAPPGVSDIAVFDAECDNNAAINVNWDVGGIQMDAGYAGTITQNAGVTLTVGAFNYTQSDGTFTGGDSAITMNGAFVLNGGTFTSTSGTLTVTSSNWTKVGTFAPSTGTVIFNAGGGGTYTITGPTTFYNLTFSGNTAGDQNISDDLIVQNNLSVTRSGSSATFIFADGAETHTISVAGNVTHSGQEAMEGDLTIVMNGTGTQTVTTSSTGKIGSLQISNTSAAVVLGSHLLMQGMLTIDASAELDVTTSHYNITNTGAATGGWTNNGTFSQRQGTVDFVSGASDVTITGATTFYNLTFSGSTSGDQSISDDLVVQNNLAVTRTGSTATFIYADSTETHTISVAGDVTHTGTMAMEGDLTVVMNGTGAQTVTTSSTGKIGSLQLSNTAVAVELGSHLLMQGMLTIDPSAGLDVTANHYNISNTGAVNGGWTNSGTFTQRQGTVNFEVTGANVTISGATTFYNLTFSGIFGGIQNISDDLVVQNDFNVTRTGTAATRIVADGAETHTLSVAGDVVHSGTQHLEADLTVVINGTAVQTVTTSGTGQLGDLQISNTTAEVQLGAALLVADDITVDAGADFNLLTHGITGTGSTSWTNNGTVLLAGSQTLTNAPLTNNADSTVVYHGTSSLTFPAAITTYYNLTLDESGTSDPTYTLPDAAVAVNGVLSITDGHLTFDDDKNLTVNDNGTTGTAITIASGNTFTNTGTGDLTLGGAVANAGDIRFNSSDDAGNAISISSTSAASNRNWQGAGTFSFVDVTVNDQDATGGTPASVIAISSTDGSSDNTNWSFVDPPDFTWIGAGLDNNWSTGANWQGDAAPGASDTAIFDGTSTKNCTIDANISVAGIDINSGYAGTITQSGGSTITVGASGWSQDTGTFTGGSGTISLTSNAGPLTLAGGTFTSTSGNLNFGSGTGFTQTGGTFSHNSGTVTLTGENGTFDIDGTITLNNLVINKNDNRNINLGAGDTALVMGTLTLTSGEVSTGTVEARGPISLAATFDGTETNNSGTLLINGAGDQSFTVPNGAALPNLTLDNAATTISFEAGATVALDGDVTLTAGTFTASSGTLAFGNARGLTITGGTFNDNSGTVSFLGEHSTVDVNTTETFHNFTVAKNSNRNVNIGAGDTIVVNNTLTLTDGNVATGTVHAKGDITGAAGFDSFTSALILNGTGTQTLTLDAAGSVNGDITVDKPSGTVNLGAALTVDANNQDLTIAEGTFDLNGFNLTESGTGNFVVEDGGNLQLQGGETVTGTPTLDSGSTVTYNGTSGTNAIKDWTYDSLTINGSGGTFAMDAGETLGGDLTVTAGTFDANDQTLAVNGSTTINGGTLMTGTGAVTFGDAGGDAVTISSGTLTVESDADADITVNAGTWTNSGGTIEFKTDDPVSFMNSAAIQPFYNLEFDGSGQTFVPSANLDVNGAFTLTAGTLDRDTNDNDINVAGNFTIDGGAITNGSGSLILDGDLIFDDNVGVNVGILEIGTSPDTTDLVSDMICTSLTVNLGDVLNTNGYDIDCSGNVTVTGTLDLTDDGEGDGTFVYVGGNWSVTGTVTASNDSTVVFDGTGAATVTSGGQSFYNVTVNDGLIGYWKLDEAAGVSCTNGADACDASGYGTDGVWTGNAAASAAVPTVHFSNAGSLDFDGSGDYVLLDSASSTHVTKPSLPITITAWINSDDYTSSQGVVNTSYHNSNYYGVVMVANAGGLIGCQYGDGGSFAADNRRNKNGTTALTSGSWYHVACVIRGATDMDIYVNGVDDAGTYSGTGDGLTYNSSAGVIGVHDSSGGPGNEHYFNGKIDDVRLYNRSLTAAEIAALANGFHPATAASGSSVTLADALDINGDLVINSGDLNNNSTSDYAITLAGAWMNNGGKFTNDGGTVTFNGTSGTHSIQAGNEDFNILQINGSGGTWNLTQDVMITDDLDIDAGTLDTNGYDLVITDDMDIDANLDLASGYHSVMGSVDFTSGTITEDTATLVLNPSTAGETLTAAAETLTNITLTSTDGLVAWWKFDETGLNSCSGGEDACDSSASGNHATEAGTVTVAAAPAPVNFGNLWAFSFDGTDDYLTYPGTGLDLPGDYSIGFWVLPKGSNSYTIIRNSSSVSNTPALSKYEIRIDGDSIDFITGDGVTADTDIFAATNALYQWAHFACVQSGGTKACYKNGSLVGSSSNDVDNSATVTTRFIGTNRNSAGNRFLNGLLDDLRIYNRALTVSEITALADGHPLSATGTVTLQDTLDIDGDMVLGDGTFAAGANTITVAGDWTNSAAAFTYGTSTVDFDGDTQGNTISGDTTFYNLTVSTGTAKTVTFESGSTTSIADNGTLTLTGAAAQLLTLAPGTAATDWDLTVSSTGTAQSVDYVSVSHSDASDGAAIDADSGNNTDGGGTSNWDFSSVTIELYRSVGVTATDLNTGAETVAISGSTATFSGAMPDNIGVGDALVYASGGNNRLAFIHGRTSSTVYTVKDKNGNAPASASAGTAIGIYRAYASLADWESQTENANITEPVEDDVNPDLDLVAADTIMQVACYADGQDTAQVSISGWTTGASNYVRIYTPVSSSEVGTTQRHSGVWSSSAYNLTYTGNGDTFGVATPYVRIEGLQIMWDGNNINNYALLLSYAGTVGMYVSDTIITKTGTESGTAGLVVGGGITGGDLFVSNNVIYGFSDSGNRCVYIVDADSALYFYNNTVYDCETGVTGNGSTRAKNIIVQSSTDGYSGSLNATSTHNISDIAGDAPGSNPRHCAVNFQDAGNADLRLASDDTCAVNSGADLSADGSLAVSDDIAGTSRPAGAAFDVGAYEVADPDTRNFYRSVGTTATDLNVNTRTVTIEDGAATFSGAMPDIVGVGDTLVYTDEAGGTQLAFITGRTSSTVYSVRDKLGSEPAYANANAVSVYRAYASLANWESQTENANITEPTENDANPDTDLVTADYIYNVAAYADGADTAEVDIDGWTTGVNHYIKIYTPVTTSEVGTTQRHSGVWNTGAYYRSGLDAGINIGEDYVRIDGLQIDLDGGNGYAALYMNFSASPAIEISNNILREASADSDTGNSGIRIEDAFTGGTIKIWNNICYGFDDASDVCYSYFDNQVEAYFYNNTAYDCTTGFDETAFSDDMYLKNNIVQGCTTGYSGDFRSSSTNNISDDATAPHANPRHCNVAFADAGNEDFRLASNDTCAANSGADLSADADLAISDDIVGTSRPAGAAFDIGAYELADPDTRNFYRSVGTTATDLNVDGRTVTIEDGTATFSGAMPDIVGVGDTLVYTDESGGAQLAFITGRTSSTVYGVRDKLGSEPAYANANAVSVYRAYNSLANWEAQTENATITEPAENDVNPDLDLVTADSIMQVAAYADGVDTTAVTIDGWTTGASNYIRIYTPTATSEVGATQRHSGVWDDNKYRLAMTGPDEMIHSAEDFIRIEGLQLHLTSNSNFDDAFVFSADDGGVVHASHNIIRLTVGGAGHGTIQGILLNWYGSGSRTAYIYNNLIYDFVNGAEILRGVWVRSSWGAYLYNNTIHNSYTGIHDDMTSILKNNLVKGVTDGYDGAADAASTNNISDIAGDAPGSHPRYCDVAFQDEANDDFQLASGDTCAVNSGADLSGDANLAISNDAAGTSRPAGAAFDIGAHEVSDPDTRDFYRSVGTTATDLNVDSRTVTIEDGTATFSGAMPDIVGVGDTLVYADEAGGAQLAFITGRTSSTVYSVRDKLGSEPAYANANAVSVYRAYNSLANWEVQTENANITEPAEDDVNTDLDLVTADYIMQVAAYADGVDTTAVTIDGWTTGASNYIKIHTPVAASEVGSTQRHSGVYTTGAYRLELNNTGIQVVEEYVRIEGLQIIRTGSTGAAPVYITAGNAGEIHVSGGIFRSNTLGSCVRVDAASAGMNVKIWNNVMYNATRGLDSQSGSAAIYLYNNTAHTMGGNCYQESSTATITAKNNVAQNCGSSGYAGTFTSSNHNVAEDTSSPGSAKRQCAVQFMDAGSDDFRLAATDTCANNAGMDLSGDASLPFSDDITGAARGVWDAGAHEQSAGGHISGIDLGHIF